MDDLHYSQVPVGPDSRICYKSNTINGFINIEGKKKDKMGVWDPNVTTNVPPPHYNQPDASSTFTSWKHMLMFGS